MSIYVDYTNHKGERAWREIEFRPFTLPTPHIAAYPPDDCSNATIESRPRMCIGVWMVDKQAPRTLCLEHIHGFYEGKEPPPRRDAIVDAVRADLESRSKHGVVKYGTTLADNPAANREKLQHLYEELLDGANYAKWLLQEIEWVSEPNYSHLDH